MRVLVKKRKVITVFDTDLSILELINNIGPCSSSEVKERLSNNVELLLVMRALHNLVERGLLERVSINGKSLYRTKSNYKNLKPYLKVSP